MGDDLSGSKINELDQRKEKFKNFFKEKIGLDNKTLIYLGIYILIFAAFYFQFKDQFRIGKNFLFIILPIITIILFLLKKPTLAILLNIIGISFIMRLQNLPFLIDVTTNKYIPADPDAMAFLRYAQYIAENGKIMALDTLRYYPDGFANTQEFSFLAYFIVYLHKFLSIFSSNFTLELVDIIYPAIAFVISMIFFFLLVRKLFDSKIALLATTFLAIIPSYLFRTLTGISDKEAFATVFMFVAFYFYVLSWTSKNNFKAILFGSISGVATAFTNLIWGGGVFIFLAIGIFALIEILLNKFNKKDFYAYISWLLFALIVLMSLYSTKYNLGAILSSITTGIAIFTLIFYIIDYLLFEKNILKLKDKITTKIPSKLFSFIITVLILFTIMLILFGVSYFNAVIKQTINTLTIPFATNRWVRTVAENSQPYITDWINNFGRYYFWMFIFGSILLFYEMHKNLKKNALKLTIIFAIFIFGYIFSRYSPSSTFNGINTISVTVFVLTFIGLFLLFILPYFYAYYKNKDMLEEIQKFDKKYLFILIWFFIMIIAARGAVRLIFIFSPITAILAAYLIFKVIDLVKLFKTNVYKIISYIFIGFVILLLITNFSKSTLAQASSVGPTYNQQWQFMGKWIRESTSENAVFAHWWDYGYLVQYNNRATISDGGNAGGYEINHFTGRHVLTGQSEEEALGYLKSRNVTHLLIVSDEIGKYPAYSSIGSDVNYDRYSWINTFSLDAQNTQERRNETVYLYRGGFPLDEDFIYNGKVYPRQSAGVGAVFVKLVIENNQVIGVKQPEVVVVYGGEQINIPLSCVYINDEIYKFNNGINGCFRIIPVINNNLANNIGAGLYLSPRVKNSLFAQLYLFNKESDNFKVAYTDETQIPLAIFNGRLIGPYKIWQVNYPKDLKVPEEYYRKELPDSRIAEVKEEFY